MTMKVGGKHRWDYRSKWNEVKVKPGKWLIHVVQTKGRKGHQYKMNEGAKVGTKFVWFIKAKQVMRKVSPNQYKGYMRGAKYFRKRVNPKKAFSKVGKKAGKTRKLGKKVGRRRGNYRKYR